MKTVPFGYKIAYNENLERYMYIPDEDSWLIVATIFSEVSKFQCVDELANNLNKGGLKAPNGLPYSRSFIIRFISNPFYINLLEREMNGNNSYIVDFFESFVTVEEWVFAQVAIENWDVLKHPDIRSHISNCIYNEDALEFANILGKI